mmetsp:Transcript_69758/g.186048  ORF Transcript_69758/g.186048 Transcript_69758/m.186048 type:complete len:162 (+) Transcript_69758:128-613(+)
MRSDFFKKRFAGILGHRRVPRTVQRLSAKSFNERASKRRSPCQKILISKLEQRWSKSPVSLSSPRGYVGDDYEHSGDNYGYSVHNSDDYYHSEGSGCESHSADIEWDITTEDLDNLDAEESNVPVYSEVEIDPLVSPFCEPPILEATPTTEDQMFADFLLS